MATPFTTRQSVAQVVRRMNAMLPWITERGGISQAIRLPDKEVVEMSSEQRMRIYRQANTLHFPEAVQQLIFEDQQHRVAYRNHPQLLSLFELIVHLKWDFKHVRHFEVVPFDPISPAHCHRRAFFWIEHLK